MEIYSWDYSKLKRKEEAEYRKGQEQAKIYHNSLPENEKYEVKVDDPELVNEIFNIAGIHDGNTDFCYVLIDRKGATKDRPFVYMSITYVYDKVIIRSCDIADATTKYYIEAYKILGALQKYIEKEKK